MERVGIDPQTMPVSAFAGKINIENLAGTDLLEVTVKDKDPQMAAAIANALAPVFIDFISETSKGRIDKTITFLESQVQKEQKKVDASVEKMKTFLMQSPSVTQLEKELESNLEILAGLRANVVEYDIQIKGLRAAIETGEKELAALPSKIELRKSLFDDPALFQASADQNNSGILSQSRLVLLTEEINPSYVTLNEQHGLNKNLLAQTEKQLASAKSLVDMTVDRIARIQVELAEKKTRYTQLENDLNISVENYDLFNKKYTETKIAQSIKAGEASIVLVSQAHEPAIPVGPRKMWNIALSVVLGLILGLFIVLFRSYWINHDPANMHHKSVS